MRRILGNLSLSLLSLALCVAVGEAAVRLLHLDRQLQFELDDELYWRFQPNQRGFVWMGNGTFQSPPARINNLGLRGPDLAPETGTKVRIVALGDSFTFGSGVADEEAFSFVLQQQLGNGVEVINAGVPGYGIFQAEGSLRRLLPLLHPKIVLVTVIHSDIFRQPFATVEEERQYMHAERRKRQLKAISQFATLLYRQYQAVLNRFPGMITRRGVPNAIPESEEGVFLDLWSRDRERLLAMAELCKNHGASLIVMVWPQERHPEWDAIVRNEVVALAQRGDIVAAVDLRGALAKFPPGQTVIPRDGHPSAVAHRAVGIHVAGLVRDVVSDESSSVR